MPVFARVDGDFEWIIYARISDDREGQGLGVKRQTDDGYGLANLLGGKVLTVCCDNDMTANDRSKRYKRRPGYDEACRLLRAKPGRRGVISWHTDRIHRTPRELEDFIDLVEEARAEVQTVKAGHIDLSTASGRAVARTLCAWARYESEHKSERIQRKVDELAEAGSIYGGGPRPFGYDRIYSGEGPRRKIIRDDVNEPEAKIIRELARRLLGGDTLRTVTNWLNNQGTRSSTGKRWSQNAVRIMMRSGRIGGMREHRREVVGPAVWGKLIKGPDGEETWGSIITKEQHEQLRALLAYDPAKVTHASRVRTHYLSGYVFCSDCASENIKSRVGKNHGRLKYKCPPDDGCNGRAIDLIELEKLIKEFMVKKLTDPRALREIAERESDVTGQTNTLLEKIQSDEKRLSMLKAQLENEDSDVSEIPEVAASIRVINRRIAEARAKLGELSTMPSIAAQESFVELGERWDDLDLDQKRTLLALFIQRILIHPGVRGRSRFDPNRVQIVPVKKRKLAVVSA